MRSKPSEVGLSGKLWDGETMSVYLRKSTAWSLVRGNAGACCASWGVSLPKPSSGNRACRPSETGGAQKNSTRWPPMRRSISGPWTRCIFQQHGSRRPDVGSSGSQGAVLLQKVPDIRISTAAACFFYLIPTGIAVDVNRDGTILFGRKRDTTSEQAPFRCWCNDDDYFSADGGKDVALPLQLDSQDDQIDSRRDLEDFARLHLVIGCLQKAIADGTIEVGLEWRDVGQKGGSRSIKAYQAAEVDGGSEYVKKADQTWASNQVIGERGWSADGFVRSS